MVEFEKLLYIPDLKMVLIFLVSKVFQKGILYVQNEFMHHSHMHEILCQTMFGDKVLWYTQISVIITTIFPAKYQLNTFFWPILSQLLILVSS